MIQKMIALTRDDKAQDYLLYKAEDIPFLIWCLWNSQKRFSESLLLCQAG